MRFLLEQAARFDAQIQSLAAEQKQFHQQFRNELDDLTQVVGRIAQLQVAQHQRLDGLIQHGQEVDRRIDSLVEAQKGTDGRLNALISVVDDIVRHNGRHS